MIIKSARADRGSREDIESMGTAGSAARVGMVVILAVALVIGMFVFFRQLGGSGAYSLDVAFADASGLEKGVDVVLAGVPIGEVSGIALHGALAKVHLRIKKGQVIPVGSRFVVETPVLGTTGVLAVIPPPGVAETVASAIPPGAPGLTGEQATDLNTALSKATNLLDQVGGTVGRVNKLLDQTASLLSNKRVQISLQHTVDNLDLASRNGVRLSEQLNVALATDNADVRAILDQTRTNSSVALSNITASTGELRAMTQENRGKIADIVTNLQDSTAAISGLTQQANDILRSGDVGKNVAATMANLKTASDRLTLIADSLQKLSQDPAISTDLKATLHNIRETTEQSTLLLERLNKLAGTKARATTVVLTTPNVPAEPAPGAVTPTTAPPPTVRTPLVLPRVDISHNTRLRHVRVDADAYVPISGSMDQFGRLGILGFGDASRLNAQYGQSASPGSPFDYRIGLYASKLSAGFDLGLNQAATLSVDGYDPNDFRVIARGTLMLDKSMGISVGVDDLTRKAGITAGLEMRY